VATDFNLDLQGRLLLESQPSVEVSEGLSFWFSHATGKGLEWAGASRAGGVDEKVYCQGAASARTAGSALITASRYLSDDNLFEGSRQTG